MPIPEPRQPRRWSSQRRSAARWAAPLLALGASLACGADRAPGPGSEVAAAAPRLRGYDGGERFDGNRARRLLVELVERGHRQLGAAEREAALAALESELQAVADGVARQPVERAGNAPADGPELVNLVARWRPEAPRRALLATHWDTRPSADADPDPAQRGLPVPGANDGTSGVVVLIELLRVLRSDPAGLSELGVDVVLFDGEEIGSSGSVPCCPGSRFFAQRLASLYSGAAPEAAIVIDMVGAHQPSFRREASSQLRARWLNDLVWRAGRQRAPASFVDELQPGLLDDHLALLEVGVPAVLIIDMSYDAWHTRADTADRVSAETLATVGRVLLDVLAELERGSPARTTS
jgi:glutaminyl-peptide cyclotransferase